MLQIHFVVLLIYLLKMASAFMSSSFNVIYERAEVVSYNSDYIAGATTKNYKYNRTQAVTNETFIIKKDLSLSLPFKMQVQAYKFSTNEYRYFPVLFSYSICEALRNDDFGLRRLYKCGNLSSSPCPFKKGTYHVCKFYPDGERFPPNIPEGRYMMEVKLFEGSTEVLFQQGYVQIKYKKLLGRG